MHAEPHAHVEGARALLQHAPDAAHLRQLGRAGALGRQFRQIRSRVRQEAIDLPGALDEQLLEQVPGPLDGVLDGVGEVLQRTQRDRLFRGVLRVPIRLREVRQHHLHVGLRPQGAGLQQRLGEPHAAGVHVDPRLDVVQGVDDGVQAHPKRVIERVLGVHSDPDLHRGHLERTVHGLGCSRGRQRLWLPDITLSKKKLPVQVRDLDAVHVSDGDLPVRAAASADHGQALQVLAAERPRADQEDLEVRNPLLEGLAEDRHLVVVAAAERLPIRRQLRGHELEHIEIQPLVQGRVLASEFDHLLGHDAAEEGGHRADHAASEKRGLGDDVSVHLLNRQCALLLLPGVVYLLGERDALRGRGRVPDGGQLPVLLPVALDGLHGKVQLLGPAELGQVGHAQVLAALGPRLRQGPLVRGEPQRRGHLDLADDALPRIRRIPRCVLDREGVRARHPDLPGRRAVQLGHPLDLPEGDPVAVLEAVAPLVVRVHSARVFLRHACHNGVPRLLPVLVSDGEAVAVIDEGRAAQAEAIRRDETHLRRPRPAQLVAPNQLRMAGA
mmetsp:Transcript_6463/g.19123  ORF Transcript_6463/g.19123 Transcript_6463/m.19123 type:complete len:555 (+) Transcript_6463:1017-2681(+)